MIEFLSALSLYTCLILGIVVLWMIILFLADCSLGKTKSIYQIAKVVLWKYKANDDWGTTAIRTTEGAIRKGRKMRDYNTPAEFDMFCDPS